VRARRTFAGSLFSRNNNVPLRLTQGQPSIRARFIISLRLTHKEVAIFDVLI
jgi:hypothetical protein